MSAIAPEFKNFMKKLEEYGDECPPQVVLSDLPTEFEFDNSICYICNGYYGPSFGEPVCATCHAFLFPAFPSYWTTSYFSSEKTDDGDSGNDEPSDTYLISEKRLNKYCQLHPWFCGKQLKNDNSPEDEANRDNLAPAANPAPGPNSALAVNPASAASGSINNDDGQKPGSSGNADVGLSPPTPAPTLAKSLQDLSTARIPDNLAAGLVEQLPSEVLLTIFGYLDDLSLCACTCVCTRWRRLVLASAPPPKWAPFVAKRWPFFKPLHTDVNWYQKYRTLVDSSFCRNCLVQMCAQAQPEGEECSWRRNRLRIELKMLRNDPPEGIAATPLDTKCCHWHASVAGPMGSPYEGGVFYLYIQVPYTYPMSPPVVRFLTRILHPNVSRHGDVGIDSVHHNWSLALTVSKVLISIQSLLTDPYTSVCMEPELGEMYVKDRSRFNALARRWTWQYAMHDILLKRDENP